jgi:hypothetical protein
LRDIGPRVSVRRENRRPMSAKWFEISFPDTALSDLGERLARTS